MKIINKNLIIKDKNFDMPIVCINLDRRIDRWESIQKQASILGITINRFKAIEAKDPKFKRRPSAEGCRLSHYNCMKLAHEMNFDRIMVLEDDASFHNDFINLVKHNINIIDTHFPEWTIFQCGDRIKRSKKTKVKEIIKPKKFWSNVCYVYNKLNDQNFLLSKLIDKTEKKYYKGTDELLSDFNNRGIINLYSPIKSICSQNCEFISDLWTGKKRLKNN